MRVTLMVLASLLLGGIGPAVAHHSYAMFDRTRELTVTGDVKAWQFTNPHSWLQVLVKGADGAEVNYGFESANPLELSRLGWTRSSLQPGDHVTVSYQPLRNGALGGELVSVVKPDGAKLLAQLPRFKDTPPAN
jgi:Family of unknown function (DUF6152)